MKLKLYKTISKHNVINKTLTDLKEIDIKLKNSESFETPNILLSDKKPHTLRVRHMFPNICQGSKIPVPPTLQRQICMCITALKSME